MQNIKLIILVLFCGVLHNTSVNAQTTDSTGSIKGKAKDSIYNFMLTSATVAVYKDADGALLQYTLPNNFGEFTVEKLPFNIPLKLVLTHVGYKDLVKQLSLSPTQKIKDLGTLFLYQNERDSSGNILEEVVVKSIPPMRMNGDTIEFNADAFNKMDKNATAEDLMRRLPGFTIWSDGEITYNGKKINAVLVGGKPFMGSTSASVATQNLPKDALDKIQVYQQRDEKNPLDSTMFANIKLKENKKLGYFGKISTGMGSSPEKLGGSGERLKYAADGMLSVFNKKLQVTTVGAFNNINKQANSTEVLLKNSSFKSEGTQMDYQSDFELPGWNKHIAGGAKLQYDFIPETAFMKSSRLNTDYFYSHNKNQTNNTSTTNWFLQNDTVLSRLSSGNNEDRVHRQNLQARWNKESEKYTFSIFSNAAVNRRQSQNTNTEEQFKTGIGKTGYSHTLLTADNSGKNFSAGFHFDYRDSWRSFESQKQRVSKKFILSYQFENMVSEGSSFKKSQFTDLLKAASNQYFDRMYERDDAKSHTHTISVKYPELKKLLLNKRTLGGVEIAVVADMVWSKKELTSLVKDKDTVTHQYLLNKNLSYQSVSHIQNMTPAIHFEKNFYKGLTNRFGKSVSLQLQLKEQFFREEHQSSLLFQNYQYQYQKFIPQASFSYYNHQYGSYEARYGLGFATSVVYPDVQKIAPLVDSSAIWLIQKGNKNLQPQYKKGLSATYNFTTRTAKNPLILDANIDIGKWDDFIADSVIYSSAGVRTVYPVNIQGYQFVNGGIKIQKMIALQKHHTLEINADYKIYNSKNPQYINADLIINKSASHNPNIKLGYRFKDKVALKIEEGWFIYKSRQNGNNGVSFTSKNQFTKLIGILQLPKNLVWSTNITYNKNTGSYTNALYYTIWNAGIIYRFLKGNRGEVKMEALDLLRQNKGVINTSTANVQTFAVTNVLQNYYMLTLSYFPRKFGK